MTIIEEDKKIIIQMRFSYPKHLSAVLRKRYPAIYDRVINYNKQYNLECESLSQSIYNYAHLITSTPRCSITGEITKWWGHKWRYREYAKRGVMSQEKIKARGIKRSGNKFTKKYIDFTSLEAPAVSFSELCINFDQIFANISNYSTIGQRLKFQYPALKKQIYDFYIKLHPTGTMREFVFLIKNHMEYPPVCEFDSDNICSFISCTAGYKTYNTANVFLKKQSIISKRIDTAIVYDKHNTLLKLGEVINTIPRQNIRQSLLKINPNLVKSIELHGDDIAKTFSHKCHMMLYGLPEYQEKRIKPEFMGFDTGYAERFKHTNTSAGEEELYEFISQLVPAEKYRDEKEIDIFIPSLNIGIEYNGEYYHSNIYKDKNYHIDKTMHFNSRGIKLYQIFENEWYQKKNIIKSILKSKLGIFENQIYARKCVVREVSSELKRNFLESNHLQGNDKSFLNLGLYTGSNLIAVMTFCRRKITGTKTLELSRFCTLLNMRVTGGASKLFKAFIKNYYDNSSMITTYTDLRFSQGSTLYENLGFKSVRNSTPNYFYFKSSGGGQYTKLYHRSSFMKHMLKFKLKDYNDQLTEKQNMANNGYFWIYDCGATVYQYLPASTNLEKYLK